MIKLTDLKGNLLLANPHYIMDVRKSNSERDGDYSVIYYTGQSNYAQVKETVSEIGNRIMLHSANMKDFQYEIPF